MPSWLCVASMPLFVVLEGSPREAHILSVQKREVAWLNLSPWSLSATANRQAISCPLPLCVPGLGLRAAYDHPPPIATLTIIGNPLGGDGRHSNLSLTSCSGLTIRFPYDMPSGSPRWTRGGRMSS